MKKHALLFTLCIMLLFAACGPSGPQPQAQQAEMEHVSMPLFGMNCEICEADVTEILTDMGLIVLQASAEDDWVEFKFNPEVHSLEEIIDELAWFEFSAVMPNG